MFILRRITGEGHQVNECLGQSYHLIEKEFNLDEFDRTYEIYNNGSKEKQEVVYAFISYNDGNKLMPLYRPSRYYIMTESGATFANLTYR